MNEPNMTETEKMFFDKLESIEMKVDKLPTKETVKDWIAAAVLQHTLDCINQKKAFPSVAPSRLQVVSEETKERLKFWGVLASLVVLLGERFLNQ